MVEAEEQGRTEKRLSRHRSGPPQSRAKRWRDPKHPAEQRILAGGTAVARGAARLRGLAVAGPCRCDMGGGVYIAPPAMTDAPTLPILLVPDQRLRAKAKPVWPRRCRPRARAGAAHAGGDVRGARHRPGRAAGGRDAAPGGDRPAEGRAARADRAGEPRDRSAPATSWRRARKAACPCPASTPT